MRIVSMKVEKLDLVPRTALTVAYGSYAVLNYALVKVYTDDRHVGLGEASPDPMVTGETQSSVMDALEKISSLLIGLDPFDIDSIMMMCLQEIPEFPAAMAAVDMAMYDLMGKSIGVPAYRLLGGKSRNGIGLYPVIPLDEPATMAAMSKGFADMGLPTMKIKLGTKPEEDLARLVAIRDVVGNSIKLRLDINQGWKDARTAIAAIRSMEGFNLEYIEQPVAATDLEGLAEVSAAVDLPVMADESCHGPADALKIVAMKAADMINIKLMKCGGIYQASAVLSIARAAGIPCILGSMGESTIASLAGLHFVTARHDIVACEVIGPLFIENDPATGFQVDMATFMASPNDEPGLGASLA